MLIEFPDDLSVKDQIQLHLQYRAKLPNAYLWEGESLTHIIRSIVRDPDYTYPDAMNQIQKTFSSAPENIQVWCIIRGLVEITIDESLGLDGYRDQEFSRILEEHLEQLLAYTPAEEHFKSLFPPAVRNSW